MKIAHRKVGFFHGSAAEGIRTPESCGLWPLKARKGHVGKSNFDLPRRRIPPVVTSRIRMAESLILTQA